MKLREHRGSLIDSMKTIVVIEPTMTALVDAIQKRLLNSWNVEKEKVHVTLYGFDERINWNTHIVTIDSYGVYGFTDGPISE